MKNKSRLVLVKSLDERRAINSKSKRKQIKMRFKMNEGQLLTKIV